MFKANKNKKVFLSLLIGIFVFVEMFGFILFARPAQAFPVAIMSDIPKQIETIKNTIKDSLTSVALGGLVKAMSTFMNKLAKDTAMYIASGGKGQGAMIFQEGAASYFKKTALSASSGIIDDYAGTLTKLTGVDPNKIASMMTALRNINSDPMKALQNGDLSGFASALSPVPFDLGSLEQAYGLGGASQASLAFLKSVKEGGSLDKLTEMNQTIGQEIANQLEGATAARSGDTGFKPVSTLISGIIKTPATTIQEEAKALTSKNQGDLNAQQVAGIYGNATLKTIPTAMMTFLSTLTSELMKKIMSGDWFDEAKKISTNYKGSSDSFYSQFIISNRNRAQSSFSFLFKVPTRDTTEYTQLITELANCGEGSEKFIRGVNNCVIDKSFMDVLLAPEPMTVYEALNDKDTPLLDLPFISPQRTGDNASDNCAEKGYCYYNIQKLRKLRIVPLGFEIAAKIADPDNLADWTLRKVVEGFNDCDYTKNPNGERNNTHPYCHLIDPNWILKAPSVRCEAQVYGATLAQEGGNIRISECADFSTKVSNKAPNYYSYCTREKNIWTLDAGSCDEQYSTCNGYTNTQDNTSAFYLSRTLDFGNCSDKTVGCLSYSTEKDSSGAWKTSAEMNIKEKILGRPGTIYFNDKVKSCEPSSIGCNQFKQGLLLDDSYVISDNNIYFKKAPDYLGCYDLDISSPEIDYPKTTVELNQMGNKPEACANFSQLCVEDEVDCKSYSMVNSVSGLNTAEIPAIIGNNSCRSECNGYETYRQSETNFAPSEFPLYFIPDEATSCQQSSVGCDEFTNIDILEKGGEGLQYYTRLQRCELPTETNEKPFYSWQGSSESGYVLKVHRLLPVDELDAAYISGLSGLDQEIKNAFEEGSPAYYDDYKESLEESYNNCNASIYNADPPLPNTEDFCSALYDKKGNVYYRLLKKTVTVSESCQPLRKTESLTEVDKYIKGSGELTGEQICNIKSGVWENEQCKRCYSGGEYRDGVCYYWTIPTESDSCPAVENGCREYKGNSGNNIQNVLFNDFEGGEIGNWKAIENSNVVSKTEALKVGEYSLGINGGAYYSLESNSLIDSLYEVSFWAKGNNQKLTITLEDNSRNKLGNFTFDSIRNSLREVSLSSEWRYYKLGPIQINNIPEDNEINLVVSSTNSNLYFIDNFSLNRVQDVIYKIKDSWKKDYDDVYSGITDVPYVCDTNPDDAYPGEALGCKAYRDQTTSNLDGKEVLAYATGFEKLCRPGAVGCTRVYDTYNTDSPEMEVYNAKCEYLDVAPVKTCTVKLENDETYSCDLINNESSCYLDKVVTLPADFEFNGNEIDNDDKYKLSIDSSSVVIPADTPVSSPLFLTYTKNYKCENSKYGCQEFAQEEKLIENGDEDVFSFPNVVSYLNQPDTYSGKNGILCSSETAGCGSFVNDDGGTEYFKDPKVMGNVLCEYVDSTSNESGNSGWYMVGVGRCENDTNKLCTKNEDCSESNCVIGKNVPCYQSYQKIDGSFGVWSNDSVEYRGLVGQCPESQIGCIELKDPQDKSQYYPEGKSYYVLKKDLSNMTGECNGMVNLVDGCVLFDRTDDPTKLYSSEGTYNNSINKAEKTGYKSVLPTTTGTRDSNLILKVNRDRECGEWLYCRTAVEEKDENGKIYQICPDYGVCNQLDENGNCITPVTNIDSSILDVAGYTNRGVMWDDQDYTGYSLLDKKHISKFDTSKVGDNKEFVLTNDGTNVTTTAICKAFPEESSPFNPDLVLKKDPTKLGSDSKNSPFVRYLFDTEDIRFSLYSQANICQTGDCGCAYMKVEYQSGANPDYWPITSKDVIPPGVCSGGKDDGKPCDDNDDCGESLSCSFVSKKTSYYGSKGFCLEYDKSRPLSDNSRGDTGYPCTTWLPFDIRVNNYDQYNMDQSTGYTPGLDTVEGNLGEVFCTEATQGYLYDKTNYKSGFVETNFDVTSPSLIINNYGSEETSGEIPYNMEGNTTTPRSFLAKWFYSNLQSMMWKKVGSTATVLFSRIPLNIFAGYAADDPSDKNGGGFMFGEDGTPLGEPYNEDASPLFDPDNNEWLSKFYGLYVSNGFEGKQSPLRFTLGNQYPILLDDIRSLYLSPLVFKKKNAKTYYGTYDVDKWNPDRDGYTIFDKFKIDVDTLKTAYENRDKFSDSVKTDNFDKYPEFTSNSKFIYLYNGLGNGIDGAVNYPSDQKNNGGGGTMHTYSFYGKGTDGSIRLGVIIDISDPYDYYSAERSNDSIQNEMCLVDKDLMKDGAGKQSVYDVIDYALKSNSLDQEKQKCESIKDPCTFGSFAKNLKSENSDKENFKEYAIIMFVFDNNNYLTNYTPYVGGQFRFKYECHTGCGGGGSEWGSTYTNSGAKKFLYGLTMSVTADLKAKCTEFDVVHQDINSVSDNQLNKAWTDRVWIEAQKKNGQIYGAGWFNGRFNLFNYNKDGGSLYGISPNLDADVVKKISGNEKQTILDILTRYYFTKPEDVGYPLTCYKSLAADSNTNLSILQNHNDQIDYCDSLLSGIDNSLYQQFFDSYKSNMYPGWDGDPQSFEYLGKNILSKLFAKSFGRVIRDPGNIYNYSDNSGEPRDNVMDSSEVLSKDTNNNLIPPQIYSLDVKKCKVGGGTCIADKKNDFTINGVGYNEASCVEEKTCTKEPIISVGSYTAQAKFFVFADTNKMPIKSIKINWGDGKSIYNDGVTGFYANRKPFCEVQTHCIDGSEKTQLTCKTSDDCAGLGSGATCSNTDLGRISFGDSARACKDEYYAVTYNYTCGKNDPQAKTWDEIQGSLNSLEKAALFVKGYPTEGAKYCVYQPKVQVMDNWGWCNGSCQGDNGCYESECSNSNADSWTTYPGKIIIVAN